MNSDLTAADQALQNSRAALQNENRPGARYWAQRAAWLAPDSEEPWLMLAEVSTPTASLAYLQRALKINPASHRARIGIEWAQARLTAQTRAASAQIIKTAGPTPGRDQRVKRFLSTLGKGLTGLTLVILLAALGLGATWLAWPDRLQVVQAFIPHSSTAPIALASPTPVLPLTPIASPTFLRGPTPTPLPSPTVQATDALEPTALPTATVPALDSLVDAALNPSLAPVAATPAAPPSGEKRILVDISEQHLYAYQGDQLVYSFVASTGMDGGTLTGNFSILDKEVNAYSAPWGFWMPDWLGIYYVGSDLENGIHSLPVLSDGSEIWGNDIGKPITYGCVVLGPQDAKMVYNWVDIGTPVEIQR